MRHFAQRHNAAVSNRPIIESVLSTAIRRAMAHLRKEHNGDGGANKGSGYCSLDLIGKALRGVNYPQGRHVHETACRPSTLSFAYCLICNERRVFEDFACLAMLRVGAGTA